jgi:hypothetical protein
MTLIVATPTEMVADSFLGNEDVRYSIDRKIFVRGTLAVGVAGSLKALRAIKHLMATEMNNMDIEFTADQMADYLAVSIKDAEYQVLIADGLTLWESNEAGDTFEIVHSNTPFGAIGQGYQYALGYMYGNKIVPREAIWAGIQFCPLVAAPIQSMYYEEGIWYSDYSG